jgi:hypothetical protein
MGADILDADIALSIGYENSLKFEQTCSSELTVPNAKFPLDMRLTHR